MTRPSGAEDSSSLQFDDRRTRAIKGGVILEEAFSGLKEEVSSCSSSCAAGCAPQLLHRYHDKYYIMIRQSGSAVHGVIEMGGQPLTATSVQSTACSFAAVPGGERSTKRRVFLLITELGRLELGCVSLRARNQLIWMA